MTDAKIKTAAKKPPIYLVPLMWLFGVARVFGYGLKKYAPGNWFNATLEDGAGGRYVGATQRHLAAMQEPNGLHTRESLAALDDESGLPHIDHALCSLIMLRGILVKEGVLAGDPGEGKEPPKEEEAKRSDGWANVLTGLGNYRAPLDRATAVLQAAGELDRDVHVVEMRTQCVTPAKPRIPPKRLTWEKIDEVYTTSDRPVPPVDAPPERAKRAKNPPPTSPYDSGHGPMCGRDCPGHNLTEADVMRAFEGGHETVVFTYLSGLHKVADRMVAAGKLKRSPSLSPSWGEAFVLPVPR